jgi:ribonucleoside-diphosphate reductase beta chain
MGIRDTRNYYKPFEYPHFEEYTMEHQGEHWLPQEVNMDSDIADWKSELTEVEKHVIGSILKSFTQIEVLVGEYWSAYVAQWFKKPEIQAMALTFASYEVIHQQAYSYLNDSLGLDDYKEFLQDESAKGKLDNLMFPTGRPEDHSDEEVAKSLATFSALGEGVLLFSSFAILLSFCTRNKLKGMRQIITWSITDEDAHSNGGCDLFNTFITEKPEVFTDDFKNSIRDGARLAIDLEDKFIDEAFKMGPITVARNDHIIPFTSDMMKVFIRDRANKKLKELNMPPIWRNLDKSLLEQMDWFDYMTAGDSNHDFFAGKNSSYSKGHVDWSKISQDNFKTWEDDNV